MKQIQEHDDSGLIDLSQIGVRLELPISFQVTRVTKLADGETIFHGRIACGGFLSTPFQLCDIRIRRQFGYEGIVDITLLPEDTDSLT